MEKLKLAIVIPALNEAANISKIIEGAKKFGDVIVVDDGSIDQTGNIAKTCGAILVSNFKSYGYDSSIEIGILEAKKRGYEALITIDADGQHNPNNLGQIKNKLLNGSDVVLGVRPKNKITRIAEKIYCFLYGHMSGIHDPLSGMKGYKIKVYEHLGCFDSYKSIGFELTIFSKKNKYKITEVNIEISDRKGESKFGGYFAANYKILKSLIRSISKYGF